MVVTVAAGAILCMSAVELLLRRLRVDECLPDELEAEAAAARDALRLGRRASASASGASKQYGCVVPARPNRKNVLWIHLHRFGGTFICTAARAQGECCNGSNCQYPGETCSDARAKRTWCRRRAESPLTFTAIERDITDEDVSCGGLLLGTMLRDPLDGAASTFFANHFNATEVLNVLRAGRERRPLRHTPCIPAWDTYHHFDNFIVRSLGGAYRVGPRRVTRQHLAAAKERLLGTDVLLILEELATTSVQLAALGWDMKRFSLAPKTWENRKPSAKKSLSSVFSTEEIAFLKSVNHLDYELFAFAKSLAQNLTDRARRALVKG